MKGSFSFGVGPLGGKEARTCEVEVRPPGKSMY